MARIILGSRPWLPPRLLPAAAIRAAASAKKTARMPPSAFCLTRASLIPVCLESPGDKKRIDSDGLLTLTVKLFFVADAGEAKRRKKASPAV